MTDAQVKQKAECIALGTFLSAYPDNLTFDKILELMEQSTVYELDDFDINVWQPFEDHSTIAVASYIEDLYKHIILSFNNEDQELRSKVRTA
jgi:hypothetical protein